MTNEEKLFNWEQSLAKSVQNMTENLQKSVESVQKSFDFAHIADDSDMVNHPPHYESGQFECIDVMVETQGVEAVQNFCICNAFKYLYRHRMKHGVEDVEKAQWYLKKYLELEERDY